METTINSDWKEILHDEFKKPYFKKLQNEVSKAYQNKKVYPASQNIFSAFNLCPFYKVKVVILGQDPYHNKGQAHGLSFSVPNETKIPPSLKNIYREIKDDIGVQIPSSGNLTRWAEQGVLLLNTTLTVEENHAGSHQDLGWETFTDAVIKKISEEKEHVVFLLWGKYAQTKTVQIDENKHLILTAPHPSPLSAYTGFFGCKHFSQTNKYLLSHHLQPINW